MVPNLHMDSAREHLLVERKEFVANEEGISIYPQTEGKGQRKHFLVSTSDEHKI